MPSEFLCPRCNYSTLNKIDMKRHFERLRICPNENAVELTEQIKEIVLRDRKYHADNKPKIQSIVQNIGYLNQIARQIDTYEKLDFLSDQRQTKLIGFEDGLENFFLPRNRRIEDKTFSSLYALKEDDFINMIDKVTKIDKNNLEKLNIIFDKKLNRFQIYSGTKWESYLQDNGLKELVSLMKSYFFDNYELYLIKNLYGDNAVVRVRKQLQDHLEIYYHFLTVFDLPIYVFGMTDEEILGHRLVENNDHHLEKLHLSLYDRIKSELKECEKIKLKKKIINIVKENSIHNIQELNKVFLQLLNIDDKFRATIETCYKEGKTIC